MDFFEQLVIVAVIHTNSDQDRTWDFECLPQLRCYFLGGIQRVAFRTKSFGVLDDVDWAKLHARRTLVLGLFLNCHHVVGTIANVTTSLTNLSQATRGLAVGGDDLPGPMLSFPDTNSLQFSLVSSTDYPTRQMHVVSADLTSKAHRRELFSKWIGDLPSHGVIDLGTAELDPAVTNYLKLEIQALNGYSRSYYHFVKSNEFWCYKLYWQWKQMAGRGIEITPTNMNGVIVVE